MTQAPSVHLEGQDGVESVPERPLAATPLAEAPFTFEAGLQGMLETVDSFQGGHLSGTEKVVAMRRIVDKVNRLEGSVRCTGQPMTEEQERVLVDIQFVHARV